MTTTIIGNERIIMIQIIIVLVMIIVNTMATF